MRTAIGRMAGPLSPPMHVRDLRPARLDVDGHGQEGVDERDGVGAGVLGGARERGDVGDVRRQLRDDRQVASTLRTALTTSSVPIEAAAELDAALLDVRAGDVELDGGDALGVATGCAPPRRTRRSWCRRR